MLLCVDGWAPEVAGGGRKGGEGKDSWACTTCSQQSKRKNTDMGVSKVVLLSALGT